MFAGDVGFSFAKENSSQSMQSVHKHVELAGLAIASVLINDAERCNYYCNFIFCAPWTHIPFRFE